MFEKILENLLKSILGEYIENLDPKKLSVSIWSGNIILQDLFLKTDILKKIGLPFNLKLGVIKKFEIEIPWTRLSSQPIKCKIDQLYIILNPQQESDWQFNDKVSFDAKKIQIEKFLQKQIQQAKLLLAQKIQEEIEKRQLEGQNKNKEGHNQGTYFERYLTRIKDNLRLSVFNVHIRFEDSFTQLVKVQNKQSNKILPTFTIVEEQVNSVIGITLKEASLKTLQSFDQEQTLNISKTERTFFFDATRKENKDKPLKKEFSIKGFSIYVDSDKHTILLSKPQKITGIEILYEPNSFQLERAIQNLTEQSNFDILDWSRILRLIQPTDKFIEQHFQNINQEYQPKIIVENELQSSMNFILKPQNIVFEMTQKPESLFRQIQQVSDQVGAKLELSVQVDRMNFQLQKQQYEALLSVAGTVKRFQFKQQTFNRFVKYKPWRPLFPILMTVEQIQIIENEILPKIKNYYQESELGIDDCLSFFQVSNYLRLTQNLKCLEEDT